jgi:hypothetical protein
MRSVGLASRVPAGAAAGVARAIGGVQVLCMLPQQV